MEELFESNTAEPMAEATAEAEPEMEAATDPMSEAMAEATAESTAETDYKPAASNKTVKGEVYGCLLSGTPHCTLLNSNSCKDCFVRKLSREDQELVMEDIKMIAAAMPYGGVEKYMDEDKCMLCASERRTADGGYARFDIGHLHPTASEERKDGSRKYKRDTSLVVPLQLPVCKKCRRRIQLINFLPLAVGVIIAFAGFITIASRPIFMALSKFGRPIPLLSALIAVFLGIIVGNILKIRLTNSASTKTYISPERIKAISELMDEGWFVIPGNELDLPYTFSKNEMRSGLLTGRNQEQVIEEIIRAHSERN